MAKTTQNMRSAMASLCSFAKSTDEQREAFEKPGESVVRIVCGLDNDTDAAVARVTMAVFMLCTCVRTLLISPWVSVYGACGPIRAILQHMSATADDDENDASSSRSGRGRGRGRGNNVTTPRASVQSTMVEVTGGGGLGGVWGTGVPFGATAGGGVDAEEDEEGGGASGASKRRRVVLTPEHGVKAVERLVETNPLRFKDLVPENFAPLFATAGGDMVPRVGDLTSQVFALFKHPWVENHGLAASTAYSPSVLMCREDDAVVVYITVPSNRLLSSNLAFVQDQIVSAFKATVLDKITFTAAVRDPETDVIDRSTRYICSPFVQRIVTSALGECSREKAVYNTCYTQIRDALVRGAGYGVVPASAFETGVVLQATSEQAVAMGLSLLGLIKPPALPLWLISQPGAVAAAARITVNNIDRIVDAADSAQADDKVSPVSLQKVLRAVSDCRIDLSGSAKDDARLLHNAYLRAHATETSISAVVRGVVLKIVLANMGASIRKTISGGGEIVTYLGGPAFTAAMLDDFDPRTLRTGACVRPMMVSAHFMGDVHTLISLCTEHAYELSSVASPAVLMAVLARALSSGTTLDKNGEQKVYIIVGATGCGKTTTIITVSSTGVVTYVEQATPSARRAPYGILPGQTWIVGELTSDSAGVEGFDLSSTDGGGSRFTTGSADPNTGVRRLTEQTTRKDEGHAIGFASNGVETMAAMTKSSRKKGGDGVINAAAASERWTLFYLPSCVVDKDARSVVEAKTLKLLTRLHGTSAEERIVAADMSMRFSASMRTLMSDISAGDMRATDAAADDRISTAEAMRNHISRSLCIPALGTAMGIRISDACSVVIQSMLAVVPKVMAPITSTRTAANDAKFLGTFVARALVGAGTDTGNGLLDAVAAVKVTFDGICAMPHGGTLAGEALAIAAAAMLPTTASSGLLTTSALLNYLGALCVHGMAANPYLKPALIMDTEVDAVAGSLYTAPHRSMGNAGDDDGIEVIDVDASDDEDTYFRADADDDVIIELPPVISESVTHAGTTGAFTPMRFHNPSLTGVGGPIERFELGGEKVPYVPMGVIYGFAQITMTAKLMRGVFDHITGLRGQIRVPTEEGGRVLAGTSITAMLLWSAVSPVTGLGDTVTDWQLICGEAMMRVGYGGAPKTERIAFENPIRSGLSGGAFTGFKSPLMAALTPDALLMYDVRVAAATLAYAHGHHTDTPFLTAFADALGAPEYTFTGDVSLTRAVENTFRAMDALIDTYVPYASKNRVRLTRTASDVRGDLSQPDMAGNPYFAQTCEFLGAVVRLAAVAVPGNTGAIYAFDTVGVSHGILLASRLRLSEIAEAVTGSARRPAGRARVAEVASDGFVQHSLTRTLEAYTHAIANKIRGNRRSSIAVDHLPDASFWAFIKLYSNPKHGDAAGAFSAAFAGMGENEPFTHARVKEAAASFHATGEWTFNGVTYASSQAFARIVHVIATTPYVRRSPREMVDILALIGSKGTARIVTAMYDDVATRNRGAGDDGGPQPARAPVDRQPLATSRPEFDHISVSPGKDMHQSPALRACWVLSNALGSTCPAAADGDVNARWTADKTARLLACRAPTMGVALRNRSTKADIPQHTRTDQPAIHAFILALAPFVDELNIGLAQRGAHAAVVASDRRIKRSPFPPGSATSVLSTMVGGPKPTQGASTLDWLDSRHFYTFTCSHSVAYEGVRWGASLGRRVLMGRGLTAKSSALFVAHNENAGGAADPFDFDDVAVI